MTPALQRFSWPTLTCWVTGETWSLWGSLWTRAKPVQCGLGQPGPSPPTPAGSSSAPWLWWPHGVGWGKGGQVQLGHESCRGDRPAAQLVPKGAAVAPPAEVICGGSQQDRAGALGAAGAEGGRLLQALLELGSASAQQCLWLAGCWAASCT